MADGKEMEGTMFTRISELSTWGTNFVKTPIGIGHGLLTIYAIGYTIQVRTLFVSKQSGEHACLFSTDCSSALCNHGA